MWAIPKLSSIIGKGKFFLTYLREVSVLFLLLSFLILTLSDHQGLLCGVRPNDEYLVRFLPGLSGEAYGASPLQSPMT